MTNLVDASGNPLQVQQVVCDSLGSVLVLCSDNSVWWWGSLATRDGFAFEAGLNNYFPNRLAYFDSGAKVVQLAACAGHFMALRADGAVSELGYVPRWDMALGWCDDCAITNSPQPVPSLPTNIISIAAGERYSLALTADGKVYEWGLFRMASI